MPTSPTTPPKPFRRKLLKPTTRAPATPRTIVDNTTLDPSLAATVRRIKGRGSIAGGEHHQVELDDEDSWYYAQQQRESSAFSKKREAFDTKERVKAAPPSVSAKRPSTARTVRSASKASSVHEEGTDGVEIVMVNGRRLVQHTLRNRASVSSGHVKARGKSNQPNSLLIPSQHLCTAGDPVTEVAEMVRQATDKHMSAAFHKAETEINALHAASTERPSTARQRAQEGRIMQRMKPKAAPRNMHQEKNEPAFIRHMMRKFHMPASARRGPTAKESNSDLKGTQQFQHQRKSSNSQHMFEASVRFAPVMDGETMENPAVQEVVEAMSPLHTAMHSLRSATMATKNVIASRLRVVNEQSTGGWKEQAARKDEMLRKASMSAANAAAEEDSLYDSEEEPEQLSHEAKEQKAATEQKRVAAAHERFIQECAVMPNVTIDQGLHRAVMKRMSEIRNDEARMLGHDEYSERVKRMKYAANRDKFCSSRQGAHSATMDEDLATASPRRPQSARCYYTPRRPPSSKRSDVLGEQARVRKAELEEDHQQRAEMEAALWQAKINRLEASASKPEQVAAAKWWTAHTIAFVVAPAAFRHCQSMAASALRSRRKDDIVNRFIEAMRDVLKRRRHRIARRARAVLVAAAHLIILKRRVTRRKFATMVIYSALRRAARKKPTMYFIHRYYTRIKQCQSRIKDYVSTRRAQIVWALVTFTQIEHNDKGRKLLEEPQYPSALSGKTNEWLAERCAKVATVHYNIPMSLKLPLIKRMLKTLGEKARHQALKYHSQRRRIDALVEKFGSREMAKRAIFAKEDELRRPRRRIIPTVQLMKELYVEAKRQHRAELTTLWLRRRKNHAFLKYPNFCVVYDNGLKKERSDSDKFERALVSRTGSWVNECNPAMATFESTTQPQLAVTFYRTLFPPMASESPSPSRGGRSMSQSPSAPSRRATISVHKEEEVDEPVVTDGTQDPSKNEPNDVPKPVDVVSTEQKTF